MKLQVLQPLTVACSFALEEAGFAVHPSVASVVHPSSAASAVTAASVASVEVAAVLAGSASAALPSEMAETLEAAAAVPNFAMEMPCLAWWTPGRGATAELQH